MKNFNHEQKFNKTSSSAQNYENVSKMLCSLMSHEICLYEGVFTLRWKTTIFQSPKNGKIIFAGK